MIGVPTADRAMLLVQVELLLYIADRDVLIVGRAILVAGR
jgi:hypothetical protein